VTATIKKKTHWNILTGAFSMPEVRATAHNATAKKR